MARSSSTYIFQQISKEGSAAGVKPGDEEARDWYRSRAMEFQQVDSARLMRNKDRLYTRITQQDVGRMLMYFYDPKHKDKLPFYDRFPLIFVMELYSDGFLGMNLHYLPPTYRARLMDALYMIERKDNVRQSQKLRMSYSLLNSAAKYRYFRPCIKRYLTNHVKSRFLYVPYEEWDIALMLPTARFRKAKQTTVWNESRKIIRAKK